MSDLAGLLAHLRAMEARVAALPDEAAIRTAPILGAAVRRVFGDDEKLRPLTESTVLRKTAAGYPSPSAPLVATGELRSSIEEHAIGPVAVAGTNDPKADWQFRGTAHIPPRPADLIGLREAGPEALRIAAELAQLAVRGD